MAKDQPIIIKKKIIHGHGHHGGSWKVAYADFVTAMMAFFMVMWIMGMSAETKDAIQGYFNDPVGFMENTPRIRVSVNPDFGKQGKPKKLIKSYTDVNRSQQSAAEKVVREIKNQIKTAPEASVRAIGGRVEFKTTGEGLLMEFTESSGVVFFESGSAVIRPAAQALILRVAPVLAETGRKIAVNGHTDSAPFPSKSYDNWDLSTDRAQAMRKLLKVGGVPSNRFVEVKGLADTQLKRPDQPGHFSNRRVTVLLPWSYGTASSDAELPKEILDAETEAAFKKPKSFVEPVNIRPGH